MDRGQAHTLEAVAAAVLVLSSVVFALQVTAVTPLTASTSSQHIENQQGAVADGVLAAASENGSLKPTLLHWNESADAFHGASAMGTYTNGGPPTAFGHTLNGTFLDRGIAFNVNLHYLQDADSRRTKRLVHFGGPSDNAVVATRTVTLYDDDRLYDADGNRTDTMLREPDADLYAPDVDSGTGVYNVVVVEVVVWRM